MFGNFFVWNFDKAYRNYDYGSHYGKGRSWNVPKDIAETKANK